MAVGADRAEQEEGLALEPAVVRLVDNPHTQVRRPGDLVALVACLLGMGLVLLVAVHGRGTAAAVTADVKAAAEQAAPTLVQLPVSVFGAFVVSLAPLAVLGGLALRRRWRTLVAAAAALVVGATLGESVVAVLTRFDPELLVGLTQAGPVPADGATFWVEAPVTGVTAMLTATGTSARSRVVRGTWVMLALVLTLAVVGGQAAPTGTLFAVLLGTAVGLAARYLTGGYADRSSGIELVRAIRRAGVDAESVVRLAPPTRGPDTVTSTVTTYAPLGYRDSSPGAPRDEIRSQRRPPAPPAPGQPGQPGQQAPEGATAGIYRRYAVTDRDGAGYDAVVLDADRQVVGLLRAVWDRFRLTGGVRRPVASVDQAADRLTLLTLAAREAGVRTPALRGVARSRDSVVVVLDRVEAARSLAAREGVAGRAAPLVIPGEGGDPEGRLTVDALVDDLWRQVLAAHRAGVAHLNLSAETVLADARGRVWVTGWFEGEVACSDLVRRIDLVQVLTMTAVLLGPQRALEAAGRTLSEAELAAIAPLLQAPVLPAPTRKSTENLKGLLASLREHLVGLVPAADTEPVQLSRFSVRSVVTATVLVGAVWTVLTTMNFAEISAAISGASPWWVAAAFGVQLLSYWAGAVTLAAYTPERIGVWPATQVHLASSVVDLVAPAAIGGATVNLRFLNRRGVSTPLGVATVALVQISQIITTVVLLVIVALGTGFALPSARPSGAVVMALVAVLVAVVVALAIPAVRRWVTDRVRPGVEQARPRITWLLANPRRMAAGIAGNLLMTLSYVGAMAASVAAFGESLPLSTLAITYLVSNSAGSAVPTPGGIGPVEAALTGGLTVAGVPAALALSIALVFRFVTFWVNIPIGWLYFRRLQRQGLL
ncbi:MAG: flippase-like domain-containing protein [Austwickia sp.]|nr:flippase-like domain-containing protein [Austwickia sp.]MBK8436998.1 flippase-like domain-containing protein [Austwickia sp.]MBK9100625.1 flippase-like domain-containing protein [Austwickia sp.]